MVSHIQAAGDFHDLCPRGCNHHSCICCVYLHQGEYGEACGAWRAELTCVGSRGGRTATGVWSKLRKAVKVEKNENEIMERNALAVITLIMFLWMVVYLLGRGGLDWHVCCAWGPRSVLQ
jgi:hypothetical protein